MQSIPVNPPSTKLSTAREISEIFGVPRATIWKWCREHNFPHFKINARVIRFRESDILQWLNSKSN